MHTAITISIFIWLGALINLIRWGKLRGAYIPLVAISAVIIFLFALYCETPIRTEPLQSGYHWYYLETSEEHLEVLKMKGVTPRIFEVQGTPTPNWQDSQVTISKNYFGQEESDLVVPPFLHEYNITK